MKMSKLMAMFPSIKGALLIVPLGLVSYLCLMKSNAPLQRHVRDDLASFLEVYMGNPPSETGPAADGTFNGFDLIHVEGTPKSLIHCIGENFRNDTDWMYRSCHFLNLCFDLETKEFIIYPPDPVDLGDDWWSSSDPNRVFVSGGAQPKTWFPVIAKKGKYKVQTHIGEFSPRVEYRNRPSSYYRLSNVTWVPFSRHPRSHQNPGHLVWDDFMSIYSAVELFDRTAHPLLLSQMDRSFNEEFDEGRLPEKDLIYKFLPLMGKHDYHVRLEETYDFQVQGQGKSMVVCADHGVAGTGTLSDHGGHHWHGQFFMDYIDPHNHGRGAMFRRYRRFMMHNIGVSPDTQPRRPYRIVFSQRSSELPKRRRKFKKQMKALRNTVVEEGSAVVEGFELHKLGLREQVELASQTSIFVSVVGGATVTANFLPEGSSLILFAPWAQWYLDWDYWNNFPGLRVHWCPMSTMGKPEDLERFVSLIRNEIHHMDAMAQFA